MAKGQEAFGHKHLAQQLAARLKNHFSDKDASASLVIGIFGEWGSGKSNLLQLVHETFENEGESEVDASAPIVVVPFNPWRYEKEEYLLVPLLKIMQRETLRYASEHRSWLEKIGLSKQSPKRIARFFGLSALAFAKAIKVKGDMPGVGGAEFSFKDFIEKWAEAFRDKAMPVSKLEALESHYFEFEHKLRKVTTGKDSIRLLFLIDDLDRCLPEKAVEMLESIKLFLDVEGCAFVLAVDDEVVERGIIHRYRDYIFQGGNGGNANKPLPQMPITGTEYLEKIIQLPFRLPLLSPAEIRAFLLAKYPQLFALPDLDDDANKIASGMSSKHTGAADTAILLDLFVRHIPPVQRKHIRAAEQVLLLQDFAEARGCRAQIKPLPLVKLALLQLFAPEVYRFGRRRLLGFMSLLEEWSAAPEWGQENFVEQVLKEKYSAEKLNFHRLYAPLMAHVEEVHGNRSGFDLFAFIKELPLGGEDLRPYLSLVVEGGSQLSGEEAAASSLAEGSLGNEAEFLALLFSQSPGAWQSAVQRPELEGRVLPADTFAKVVETLDKENELRPFAWYLNLMPVLSAEQKQRLPEAVELQRQVLTLVEKKERPVAERAEAGQLLSELGDPRAGVTVKRNQGGQPLKRKRGSKVHCLPDIAWQKIPAGTFHMGTVGDEGYDDEKPAHDVTVPEFFMSRYPVTNAQYRCFIEAGMYEDEAFWQNKLPEAAAAWWAGGEADEGLLASMTDESSRNRYRERLKNDVERRLPRFWHDRQWSPDNHPVVGISWFEALAYSVWLNDLLDDIRPAGLPAGMRVRLPSEAEWEYAARGPGNNPLRYAWGNDGEQAGALCNGRDAKLERTSAVGLFPAGEAGFKLYDMTGNVWEWSASRWGRRVEAPDFTYEQWDQQEGNRNDPNPLEFRIARGGAWDFSAGFLRCAFRNWNHPVGRYSNLGFRLVLSV